MPRLATLVGVSGVTLWCGIHDFHYSPNSPNGPSGICLFLKSTLSDRWTLQLHPAAGLSSSILAAAAQSQHGVAEDTLTLTYNVMRVRRVDQQDDGGGLAVKVKNKKHLRNDILDANRQLDNLNERVCFLPLATHHLTASSSITFTDDIKWPPDKFKIDLLSTNVENDHCFAP